MTNEIPKEVMAPEDFRSQAHINDFDVVRPRCHKVMLALSAHPQCCGLARGKSWVHPLLLHA